MAMKSTIKRTTQRLKGPALKRFLAALDGVDAATLARLSEAIVEARVRPSRPAARADLPARRPPVAVHTVAQPTVPEALATPAVKPPPAVTKAVVAEFDPFAFSVVALLRKSGKPAVLAKLAEIAEPAHLRKLAEVQHLPVGSELKTSAEIRAAVIASAERRIADRNAAAG